MSLLSATSALKVSEPRPSKYTDGMSAFIRYSFILSHTERMNQPLVSLSSRLPATPASVSGLFLCSPPFPFTPLVFSLGEMRGIQKGRPGGESFVLRPSASCYCCRDYPSKQRQTGMTLLWNSALDSNSIGKPFSIDQ